MLIFARRQLEDLADAGEGWDAEYGRDVWRLHNLGFGGRQTLRFDRIPQPWCEIARAHLHVVPSQVYLHPDPARLRAAVDAVPSPREQAGVTS